MSFSSSITRILLTGLVSLSTIPGIKQNGSSPHQGGKESHDGNNGAEEKSLPQPLNHPFPGHQCDGTFPVDEQIDKTSLGEGAGHDCADECQPQRHTHNPHRPYRAG